MVHVAGWWQNPAQLWRSTAMFLSAALGPQQGNCLQCDWIRSALPLVRRPTACKTGAVWPRSYSDLAKLTWRISSGRIPRPSRYWVCGHDRIRRHRLATFFRRCGKSNDTTSCIATCYSGLSVSASLWSPYGIGRLYFHAVVCSFFLLLFFLA